MGLIFAAKNIGLVIGIISGGVSIYEFLQRRNVPGTIYGIVAAGLIIAAIFISIFPSTSGTAASGRNQPGNTPTPTLALQQGTTVTPVQTTPTFIPSPTPSPTPTVCPLPCLLYQANWSNGANDWSGSAYWKFFNGMLINDGTDNLCEGFSIEYPPTLYSPFQPEVADYAIEIRVQIVRQTHNNCSDNGFFGVGGRLASSNGGWTGYQMVVGQGSENITDYNSRLATGNLDPGNSWHTYRFELKGTDLKLKIDGALILETSDAKYLYPGQLGIWSSALYLTISSYKVIAL